MIKNRRVSLKMRIIHRYLGFFLAGIMFVYALSGITLIFRDSDFLKQEKQIDKTIQSNLSDEELGKTLNIRGFKADREEGNYLYFKDGIYNKTTGEIHYKIKELPVLLEKMTKLHKAKSSDTLFFLNIFFGLSLLFFVLSSFWMFMPSTTVFRKGVYYALAGIAFTMVLLLY
ncbi:hypothetical protein [Yeosuana sp. AK3]